MQQALLATRGLTFCHICVSRVYQGTLRKQKLYFRKKFSISLDNFIIFIYFTSSTSINFCCCHWMYYQGQSFTSGRNSLWFRRLLQVFHWCARLPFLFLKHMPCFAAEFNTSLAKLQVHILKPDHSTVCLEGEIQSTCTSEVCNSCLEESRKHLYRAVKAQQPTNSY